MNEKGGAGIAASKVLFILIVLLAGLAGCTSGKDSKGVPSTKPASQRSVYTVVLSEEAQKTGGIVTKILEPSFYRENIEAYGTVLQPDGLLRARNSYVSAKSSLQKAEASLKASSAEYGRLKALNESDKNISDRMLQAAAAAMEVDRAAESEAHENLRSVRSAAELQWGRTISGWIFDYSPGLERLVGLEEVLVQVTIPPAAAVRSIPERIRIQPPEGRPIEARLIIHAPATDPRIQGMSYIYMAPTFTSRLIPGMNVSAYLPAGKPKKGFVVPSSAVIWLQDRAWVYVRKSGTGFVRVEVPTSSRVRQGYFVSGVFSPGDEIVVKGAQALLSEESTPETTGGGEEEDDD